MKHSVGAFRNRKYWISGAAALLSVSLLTWVALHREPPKRTATASIPVAVAEASIADVPVSLMSLGAAQAWTSVTIFAQVSGRLESVNFREGTDVHAGQLLARIDPSPYLAVLAQAEGSLKHDQAVLDNARLDLARYQALARQNAIARQQVDTQAALVKAGEGTVQNDQGLVAAARVNLNWTRILSPIDGRVGVRMVDPGNLVTGNGSISSVPSTAAATNNSMPSATNGAGIVVINQIQPIAVTFTVPEEDFQRLSDASQQFRTPLATKAFSQETGALLDTGELSIADNRVSPATGTVELKARFPNVGRKLWPGQFVNVELTLQTLHHVVTIPMAAVNRGPNGNFAYVVDVSHKATMRPIKLARTERAIGVVASGVLPGDVVVTDGQIALKDGSMVRIVSRSRP